MFTAKVKSVYAKLTAAERKVADYLILNCGEFGDVSSHMLAETLGVGQSSVIRFSKKMGYRSYTELINDVRTSSPSSTSEIEESDPGYAIIEKLGAQYAEILASVVKSNTGEELEQAADLLDRAETMLCYGYLNSRVLADYLCESLLELGKNAVCCSESVETKRRIQQLDPSKGVVVVVSKSGDKLMPVSVARFAAECGLPVIAIANSAENPLAQVATVHVKVLEIGDRSTPAVSMGTSAGVLLVVDALVACLFMKNRKQYQRCYGNSLITAFAER